MASAIGVAHLEPSALGTKEYWDEAYTLELTNHRENPSDEGTIWFSDSGAEEKMISYLERLRINGTDADMDDSRLRILDLGMGNGHLLFELRDGGWMAEMVGVDYSWNSVKLARQIHARRINEADEDEGNKVQQAGLITFEHFDILKDVPGSWLGAGFDVLVDKGTFDAISLSDETDAEGKKGCEKYASKVLGLIREGGYMVITSCNWTEKELRKWFERPELLYHETIRFPSFTFGGAEGQTVSSVCFQRRDANSED